MQVIGRLDRKEIKQVISQGLLIVLVGATLLSYIFSLNAFVSPSSELRWDGTIDYISDTLFEPGDQVFVSGTLIEGESYFRFGNYYSFFPADIRWILIVMDPNNMPILIVSDSVSANGDVDTGVQDFSLPIGAALGTYHIKMIVWSDLLPDGETRTRQIQEITFEVA